MTLTLKQENFCQHFVANRRGPMAYRHAYDVADSTTESVCSVQASKLLSDPKITDRIRELLDAMTPTVAYSVGRALDQWLTIAEADPDELIGLRVGCCRYCYGEGHRYQWREREYLEAFERAEASSKANPDAPARLPDVAGGTDFNHTLPPLEDCPECRGEGVERVVARDTSKLSPGAKMLYGGVKQTRHGVEIIIADRIKARENAGRILGIFTEKVKLDGSLQTMAQVVATATTDPHEAARMYQEMIAGKLAAK